MNLLLALALGSAPASAWHHTGWVWDSEEFPVEWWMSDYISPELAGDYQVAVQQTAIQNWADDAPCAGVESQYMGVREGHWASGPSSSDGINTVYYDDPTAKNDEGTAGVTYTLANGAQAFTLVDPVTGTLRYYSYPTDSDIVYSLGIEWASTADIDAGDCNQELSIEATSTHEFGHLWGMAHSCEEEDVEDGLCTELVWYEATMFWTGQRCDVSRTTLNSDDIEGITALYGPFASFAVAEREPDEPYDTSGGVPLEVCFQLEAKNDDYEGLAVEWSFGDGGTSTEFNPCHTYTEKGQYTVFITVTGTDDECGEFSYNYREPAFVTVCEPPQPAEGFNGMFTFEHVEDNTYQMINQADLSVYGCIDQVRWDVIKGGETVQTINAWSPKIDFGEEGSFEVVLNLGGPGGVTAETLTIDAGTDGVGCSAVGGAAAGIFGVFAGLGLALRRRER